mmetsp:Transcript_28577/g.69670  ORF Transcript_28577/g.69670 Transcript_28577/m.69670 type:complete len:267 (-) Transcript_28577:449-1249(-)
MLSRLLLQPRPLSVYTRDVREIQMNPIILHAGELPHCAYFLPVDRTALHSKFFVDVRRLLLLLLPPGPSPRRERVLRRLRILPDLRSLEWVWQRVVGVDDIPVRIQLWHPVEVGELRRHQNHVLLRVVVELVRHDLGLHLDLDEVRVVGVEVPARVLRYAVRVRDLHLLHAVHLKRRTVLPGGDLHCPVEKVKLPARPEDLPAVEVQGALVALPPLPGLVERHRRQVRPLRVPRVSPEAFQSLHVRVGGPRREEWRGDTQFGGEFV